MVMKEGRRGIVEAVVRVYTVDTLVLSQHCVGLTTWPLYGAKDPTPVCLMFLPTEHLPSTSSSTGYQLSPHLLPLLQ